MTMHRDADRNYSNRDDRVEVADGVPTDRVRWGPILAGVFAAMTMLAVLNTLGAAVGLSAYDQGDDARRFAIGAGVWGIISLLASFAFGAWLTARSSAVRGRDNGLLNGFLVAGVGIPVLMFMLGAASAMMSVGAAAASDDVARTARSDTSGDAQTASASIPGAGTITGSQSGGGNSGDARETARKTASRSAWGTLAALVLAIGASCAAGYVGGKDDRGDHHATGHTGSGHGHGTTGSTTPISGGGTSM